LREEKTISDTHISKPSLFQYRFLYFCFLYKNTLSLGLLVVVYSMLDSIMTISLCVWVQRKKLIIFLVMIIGVCFFRSFVSVRSRSNKHWYWFILFLLRNNLFIAYFVVSDAVVVTYIYTHIFFFSFLIISLLKWRLNLMFNNKKTYNM
jgi:hypothetical protein